MALIWLRSCLQGPDLLTDTEAVWLLAWTHSGKVITCTSTTPEAIPTPSRANTSLCVSIISISNGRQFGWSAYANVTCTVPHAVTFWPSDLVHLTAIVSAFCSSPS